MDLFAKLAPGIAALTAALVAVAGLGTWRRQLKGQAEYDLARRVLRAVLKARDHLNAVRSPDMTGGEIAAAYKEAGLELPERPLLGSQSKASELVYDRRWQRLLAAVRELEAELLEAEVLWGAASRAPELEFKKCFAELYSAVMMHLRALSTPNPHESLTKIVETQFRVLYRVDSTDDPDQFGKRIDGAVKAFELIVRPHLTRTR